MARGDRRGSFQAVINTRLRKNPTGITWQPPVCVCFSFFLSSFIVMIYRIVQKVIWICCYGYLNSNSANINIKTMDLINCFKINFSKYLFKRQCKRMMWEHSSVYYFYAIIYHCKLHQCIHIYFCFFFVLYIFLYIFYPFLYIDFSFFVIIIYVRACEDLVPGR